jgi:predicted small secreted protein
MGLRSGGNRWFIVGHRDHPGPAGKIVMAQVFAESPSTKQKGKMKALTKTVVCLFLLVASMSAFTGCRTAEGFGEDMEEAGEEIQDGLK